MPLVETLAEVSQQSPEPGRETDLWCRGGFPDSYLTRSDAQSMRWREAFVRSYLESTFMVRVLQPYSANLGKRLVKSPKVYLRDSGLLHTLLNLPSHDALMGHPVLAASWEGWVIEQILAQAPLSEPFPLSQRARALHA